MYANNGYTKPVLSYDDNAVSPLIIASINLSISDVFSILLETITWRCKLSRVCSLFFKAVFLTMGGIIFSLMISIFTMPSINTMQHLIVLSCWFSNCLVISVSSSLNISLKNFMFNSNDLLNFCWISLVSAFISVFFETYPFFFLIKHQITILT